MATPISRTIGQLFQLSGFGASCQPAYDLLDSVLPGWTEDTSVDLLTYDNYFRNAGLSGLCVYTYLRNLTLAQQKVYVNWAMTTFLSYVPDAFPQKAAMSQIQTDLIDYATTPTNAKKNALLATSKAIKPNTSNDSDIYARNAFKGIIYSVITAVSASTPLSGSALNEFTTNLKRTGMRLTGKTSDQVSAVILTKLEQIIGIID